MHLSLQEVADVLLTHVSSSTVFVCYSRRRISLSASMAAVGRSAYMQSNRLFALASLPAACSAGSHPSVPDQDIGYTATHRRRAACISGKTRHAWQELSILRNLRTLSREQLLRRIGKGRVLRPALSFISYFESKKEPIKQERAHGRLR